MLSRPDDGAIFPSPAARVLNFFNRGGDISISVGVAPSFVAANLDRDLRHYTDKNDKNGFLSTR